MASGRRWRRRCELGLIAGVLLAAIGIGSALGLGWLIATAAVCLTILAVPLASPASRQRIIARARWVITPHRVRAEGTHAWIQTRDGRLPAVLYTTPEAFGERVWLWCRAGLTAGDLEAARETLRATCWASDVRVVVNDRRSHIVVLEVIRQRPARRHDEGRPALYYGLGHHRPFG